MNMKTIKDQVGDMFRGAVTPEEQGQGEQGEELTNEGTEEQESKHGEDENVSGEGEDEGTESKKVEEGTGEEETEGEKGEEGEGKEGEGEDEGKEKSPIELEMEALRKQNELLHTQLNEVSGGQPKEETEEDAEAPTLEVGEDFIDADTNMDELFADVKKVNATLSKTASKAANLALEHVYKRLPEVITKIVQDEVANYRQADQFFADNKDLIPHKKFVSYVYNDMVQKDPETAPLEHFKALAKEVRKRIGMGEQPSTGQESKKNKKEKRRSSFNPPGGKRVNPPAKPTGIGAEINDMMNV